MSDLHVIFGTGAIGLTLMEALLAKGKSVRTVNRSGGGDFPTEVEHVSGDASDPAFARKAAEGASVVYNVLNPPYHLWPELFPKLQAGVLEGAAAAGAKLVVMENLYMYGDTHGQPLTENLPYAAHTKKGSVRAQMSRDLIEAHERGRVRVTMGRASDYFGPRGGVQSPLGDLVIGQALEGKPAQVIGDIDQPHTFTYIPDIAAALMTLGEHDEALGEAWHIPSPSAIPVREIIGQIYAELGQPPKIQVAPKALLWIMGRFDRNLTEIWEMMYEFDQPFVVDHSKYERAFGNHATPLTEALRATIAWHRQQVPEPA